MKHGLEIADENVVGDVLPLTVTPYGFESGGRDLAVQESKTSNPWSGLRKAVDDGG